MTDREPCFHCGEKVALDARACPHCGRSALVDLLVDAPVVDSGKRHRLARTLSAMAPGLVTQAGLLQALARKDGIVVSGVTRSFATRAYNVLAAEQVPSSMAVSRKGGGRGLPWRAIAAGVGLAALAALGVWNWRRDVIPVAGPGDPAAPVEAPALPAAAAPARRVALSTKEVAARALPSTVSIRCPDSVGSGFFVTDETVLTNAHVLCAGGAVVEVVRSDGRKQWGRPVLTDSALDLATLRVAGAAAIPLPLGDAGALEVGEQVVVIGSPMGLEFTVHAGSISNLSRALFGHSYLQVEAKVNPGNSGGPVLDDQARVVGVVSLRHAGAEGIGLALPINYAWSASPALVAAPALPFSEGFARMRASAAEAGGGEARPAAPAALLDEKPVLLGGYIDQYRRLVVKVGRLASAPPPFEMVSLRLVRGSDEICAMKGDVSEWKPFEGKLAIHPELRSWTEGGEGDRRLYVGEAPVQVDHCPGERMGPGTELILEGAHHLAARARVN
jgi:serine protease Do